MEVARLDQTGPHHSVAVCPLPWPLSRLPPSPFFLPCTIFGPMHIAMLTARGQIIIMLMVARPFTELPGVLHRPSLSSCSRSPRPSCITAGAFSGSQAGPPISQLYVAQRSGGARGSLAPTSLFSSA